MFHRLEGQGDIEKFFSASVTRLQLHGAVMSLTRDDMEEKMCFIFPIRHRRIRLARGIHTRCVRGDSPP